MRTTQESTAESTYNHSQANLNSMWHLNDAIVTEGEYETIIGNEIVDCIHFNPKPKLSLLEETKQQDQSNLEQKLTVVFAGFGDFILDDSIIKYLEDLKKQGKVIASLTLAEIEISPTLLQSVLKVLKPTLKALCILRVPLDHEHLEMLNKLELNLEFLTISYTETNQRHAFGTSQKNEKTYKPFDANLLDFKSLCPCLKYLELQGLTLKRKTIDALVSFYSETLEVLRLEDLKSEESSKKELIQHILQNLDGFRNLKGLSLAKNNLDFIFFNGSESELQENRESKKNIMFPTNLQALNLNGCNLDNKQVLNLVKILGPVKVLHLEGSYLYESSLEKISGLSRILETSKPLIEPSGRHIFSIPADFELRVIDSFTELLENSTVLENLKNSTTKPQWMSELLKREDNVRALPYLSKLFEKIKSFNDAYRHQRVEFRTNPKMLIPKHDFNEVLNYLVKESSELLLMGDSSFVGEYDGKFIKKIHPKFIEDDDWAKLPLKNQRDKFLETMLGLGYQHIEKKHKDCFEDVFIMSMKFWKQVSYDYTLATFSLFWYHNQISIKFNLSDDWYLERKYRVNRYGTPNQDFLINFCSEWNTHTNDYMFELDIKTDGETEVKFKTSIWKDGDLNVGRALLIAIDKGFVMLKALHKLELFDKGDVFKGVEDSKNVRRVLKKKLKKFDESRDFQNLLRQQSALLNGREEIEGEGL